MPRPCSVSFTDADGITHSVAITATTLYEAAVLGLAEFRRLRIRRGDAWSGDEADRAHAPAGDVPYGKRGSAPFMADGVGKSPGEHAMKSRLRTVFKNASYSTRGINIIT